MTVSPWGTQLESHRFFIAFPAMVRYTYCMLDRAKQARDNEGASTQTIGRPVTSGLITFPREFTSPRPAEGNSARSMNVTLTELIEEVGEPTAEEMARAEARWRPIEEHLTKDINS